MYEIRVQSGSAIFIIELGFGGRLELKIKI